MSDLDYRTGATRTESGEHCTEEKAKALAKHIRDYWAERGFDVEAWAEEMPFNHRMRSRRWDVRTDMVGGLPVRKLPVAA